MIKRKDLNEFMEWFLQQDLYYPMLLGMASKEEIVESFLEKKAVEQRNARKEIK